MPRASMAGVDSLCTQLHHSLLSDVSWCGVIHVLGTCANHTRRFPGDIPPNVNVPGWAYLDVVVRIFLRLLRA